MSGAGRQSQQTTTIVPGKMPDPKPNHKQTPENDSFDVLYHMLRKDMHSGRVLSVVGIVPPQM
jgi:hypothetical protein